MSHQQARKEQLFDRGSALLKLWCERNGVKPPTITQSDDPIHFGTCAYYRDNEIIICVAACASVSPTNVNFKGRAWSYPGHTVDRTPYGVLQHELGHHVDIAHGARAGRNGFWQLVLNNGEPPLSGYRGEEPNERFAELFRLFVTNPDLLRQIRPLCYSALAIQWPAWAEVRAWRDVLALAPRQAAVCEKKIAEAQRRSARPKGELFRAEVHELANGKALTS